MGHGTDLAAGRGGLPVSGSVEIIAHRGANREAPENTLEAFEKALDAGVDGIELDIQFSGDRVPVVHHDPMISRTPIAGLSVDELRRLKSVPTLAEVLELVRYRCQVYVEVKARPATDGVVRQLEAYPALGAIHSFDHRIASAVSRSSHVPTGILLVSYLVDVVGAMSAAFARDLWQQADFIDADLVREVHNAGGRVIAWTVNDAERARELISLGVDGICTDVPREILHVKS